MEKIISLIFFWLMHIVSAGSIISILILIISVVAEDNDKVEKLLRSAALAAGLLIYLGGRAYGISIPSLMAASLNHTASLLKGLYGVVIPFATGASVTWFCITMMKNSSNVAKRGLILFVTLMFTMFVDTYASLVTQASATNLGYALPNITFVLGVILYVIFRWEKNGNGEKSR